MVCVRSARIIFSVSIYNVDLQTLLYYQFFFLLLSPFSCHKLEARPITANIYWISVNEYHVQFEAAHAVAGHDNVIQCVMLWCLLLLWELLLSDYLLFIVSILCVCFCFHTSVEGDQPQLLSLCVCVQMRAHTHALIQRILNIESCQE